MSELRTAVAAIFERRAAAERARSPTSTQQATQAPVFAADQRLMHAASMRAMRRARADGEHDPHAVRLAGALALAGEVERQANAYVRRLYEAFDKAADAAIRTAVGGKKK